MAAAKEDIEAVREWLAAEVRLDRYADKLELNGFTSLELCCSINENALDKMQIVLPYHRRRFLNFAEKLREKLGLDLTNGEDGVTSNVDLTIHGSETGNEQQGPLIDFDSEEQCSGSSFPSADINSEDVNVPVLPPKKKQQSVKSPPPIPPRTDLDPLDHDQRSTAVDTHAEDLKQVSLPEKPAVEPQQYQQQQPEVAPKKAPEKPPRRTIHKQQSSENTLEVIPKTTTQTQIQDQHAIPSNYVDNTATVNPLQEREPLVQENSTSANPELSKPDEDANKITSLGEEVNEEKTMPPIEPKRSAPRAPERAPYTRPIPKPRSRVKSEDSILVSDLLPESNTANDSKEDFATRLNNTIEKRTKSFSTPGSGRIDSTDEKPSTMPRAATVKRPAPPAPPSRQTGSSIYKMPDKRRVPNLPQPVAPVMENAESQQLYEFVGSSQQGNIVNVILTFILNSRNSILLY